ncbi:MAG TPA: Slp family lipoprotein [Nitrospiraceae bacterium]|nr:Slp family lipoprotein [Nitrospiraceae bacterium]
MCLLVGCSTGLPSKYVRQAEPNVTLTSLVTHPERYQGKVVILGGAIAEERQDEGRLWLRLTNRPLDEDYHPHRPPLLEGTEGGHYWVVADADSIPKNYRNWARATVVGQVVRMQPPREQAETTQGGEPVLAVMYIRGWGASAHKDVWEDFVDPNYRLRTPRGIHGEFGGQ